MSASVYDAMVKFVGDTTSIDKSLADMPGKAGTAGQTSGKSFGSKFGAIAGGLMGAGIGAALSLTSTQVRELDTATQKLAADTGLSGDALAAQGKAIGDLYSTSLESMSSIEASLAEVISGFNLTGSAADDLTAQFLKYETATGQSSDAVKSMKMITDAWNLSAADEGTLMDQLVASHQKYATVVGDMQSAMQKIAPAMQAMGMTEKDGVDLLNLFASAGIDASKASMGLQTAVKALAPGQNLNDLIVQISSIQDPLERAQAAGKVFGTRLGSQMALALQPGITSLDQFATSADDTTNATIKAAQAVEDSWGNRFTLLMHSVLGPLAEVGQAVVGPLVLMSMVGPKMAAVIGGLGGLLAGPAAASGAEIGTSMGAAAAAADISTEIAAEVPSQVAEAILPEAATAGGEIGTAMGAAAALAIPAAIIAGAGLAMVGIVSWIDSEAQKEAAAGVTHDIHNGAGNRYGLLPGMNGYTPPLSTGTAVNAGGGSSWETDPKTEQAAADKAVAAQLAADQDLIAQAAKDGYSGIPDAAEAAAYEADLATKKGLADQIATAKSSKQALSSAWTDAFSAETDAATIQARLSAANQDVLVTEKKLRNKNLNTLDRANLQTQLAQQRAAYAELLVENAEYGTNAQKATKLAGLLQSKALLDGLASADPDVRALWEQVQSTTQDALDAINGKIELAGYAAAQGWVDGFNSRGIDMKTISTASGYHPRAYDVGSDFVPETGPAIVHRGEKILTAAQNAAITSGKATLGHGSVTINLGGLTVGAGATVGMARQMGKTLLDMIADGLQSEAARFSGFTGSSA